MRHPRGSVAQLNRASDYGSEGCGFESRRNHKENQQWFSFFLVSVWFFKTVPHPASDVNTNPNLTQNPNW